MAPLYENMMSSTKPEVHNVLQCHQRRTEPRPQVTCIENLDEWFLRYESTSDVVLKADASPRGCLKAENFDALASCELPRYFIGLPRPQKNCLCLGLDLTASILPWLIWLMGKPHKTQILVMG